MARALRFTALAARDISGAVQWYDAQQSGLGAEFEEALNASLQLLNRFPEAGPVVVQDVRRLLLRRFPYALYYRLSEQVIEIRACLHMRRDPRR